MKQWEKHEIFIPAFTELKDANDRMNPVLITHTVSHSTWSDDDDDRSLGIIFLLSFFFSLSSLNHLILKHKTCTDKRRKLAYTKKCFSASFREIVRVVHGVNFFNGEAIPKVTLTHFYGPYVVCSVQLPRRRTPPANGRKTHHSQVPIEIELWWSSGGEGFRLWTGFEAKVPWDPTKRNTSGFQLNSIRKKGWNSSKFNFRHLNKTFLRHTKKLPENILILGSHACASHVTTAMTSFSIWSWQRERS